VSDGVIGAIGVSNVDGAYLAEAIELAPIAVVPERVLAARARRERDVLPLCAEHGIEFQAFSPLAGGWLDGQVHARTPFPPARG
jgi:aryl-alcohol dehydrogenase-like predicted oxidoreductase